MRAAVLLAAATLALAQSPDPLAKAYDALRSSDYRTAIAAFQQSIALAPDRPAPHKDLAYTYLKIGENALARDHFHRAMRLDPADTHVALEYAFLAFEAKLQA